MELKFTFADSIVFESERSNRTFMELKFGSLGVGALVNGVLIVPLWN